MLKLVRSKSCSGQATRFSNVQHISITFKLNQVEHIVAIHNYSVWVWLQSRERWTIFKVKTKNDRFSEWKLCDERKKNNNLDFYQNHTVTIYPHILLSIIYSWIIKIFKKWIGNSISRIGFYLSKCVESKCDNATSVSSRDNFQNSIRFSVLLCGERNEASVLMILFFLFFLVEYITIYLSSWLLLWQLICMKTISCIDYDLQSYKHLHFFFVFSIVANVNIWKTVILVRVLRWCCNDFWREWTFNFVKFSVFANSFSLAAITHYHEVQIDIEIERAQTTIFNTTWHLILNTYKPLNGHGFGQKPPTNAFQCIKSVEYVSNTDTINY